VFLIALQFSIFWVLMQHHGGTDRYTDKQTDRQTDREEKHL